MKKFFKTILCAAAVTVLLASLGMTAMAAGSSIDDTSMINPISVSQADMLRDVASPGTAPIPMPISAAPNPATGMENLAIPGAVALIAAASAAITLAGKRK